MKRLSTLKWLGLSLCLVQLCFAGLGQQEILMTNVAVSHSNNATCNGYFLYLPQNYTASKKYPIIIAFHGSGEDGNGGSDLTRVAGNGLPAAVSQSSFPKNFTVNGSTFQFIVFAPQFTSNPEYYDCDSVINYALRTYPVDLNRVYITGYSQGGGNIWYYGGFSNANASKIAAMAPIEGSVSIAQSFAQTMANNNLAVIAATNASDPTVSPSVTINNIAEINAASPPPNPAPVLKIFQASGHDGWDSAYNPLTTYANGLNLYQWMLQFQRGLVSSLPVVLSAYSARLTGPSAVTISWTTSSEINNKDFVIERSADGITFSTIGTVAATNYLTGAAYSFIDPAPLNGNNYYRLSQVDADGHTTYFDVLNVVVASSLPSGFRLNPNPSTGLIQLSLVHPETGAIAVILSDMQGRILRTWQFDKPAQSWQQTIDIGNITPGNYTIRLKGNTIREIRQVIKQ